MSFEPIGIKFQDDLSREYLVVTEGSFKDWLCYKHPDGQWVTLRKLTQDEVLEYKERYQPSRAGYN